MIRQSKEMNNTIAAYKKGYRVTFDGHVINPEGNRIVEIVRAKYRKFSIRNDSGERVAIYTHKLQAYQKFGDDMIESQTVRHLNGNSLDNSYDNISIGSQKENMLDVPEDVRMARAINATKSVTKYNINRDEIVEYYDKVHSYSKTMEHFGISSKGTLNYILNHKYKN